jgi:hypothetical protein
MNKNIHETQFISKFSQQILFFLFFGILFFASSSRSQIFSCDLNWQPAVQLSHDSVLSITPKIVTDGNSVHIIWFGIDTIGGLSGTGIQYVQSFNNGAIFSAPRTVASPDVAFSPGQLASSGFNLYITFTGYINGTIGVGFINSADGGFTWSEPRLLRSNSQPRLIAAHDSIVIIHYADQIPNTFGLLRSGDYGTTWRIMTTNMPSLNDFWLTSAEFHAVGTTATTRRNDVGYFFSPNGGTQWYGPEIVSPEDAISSLYSKIAIDELGERLIVWNDSGSIVLRRSNGFDEEDNLRWLAPIKIPASTNAVFPDIDYTEGLLVTIWDNNFGDSGTIILQHSTEKGEPFCPPFFPSDGKRSGEPSLSLQENILSLTWSGDDSGNGEIFFRRGIFPGETRPKEALLRQNYPNPFSRITNIDYEISKEGLVRLEVFDLLGKKVETLVNQNQKPRRYHVQFNGGNLASGIYFCRFWTVQYSDVKKMILLR